MELEDKNKVLTALGGKKGLLDSTLPSIVFLIFFNVSHDLNQAIYASIGVAMVLTIVRLIQKDSLMHSISGLIGVGFCAFIAWKTGTPKGYYAPSLWKNGGYGLVYLISILVKWPLIGLLLGTILGEGTSWRKDPARLRVYKIATGLWVGMFALRLAIQYPLYHLDQFNALGVANIFLGLPLYFATLWGTWMVIKSVPVTKKPEIN
jgi:hypothetical protein